MLSTKEPSINDSKLLERFGRNLTDLALKGKLDPVIGRENEIRRLINILSRRSKNNPVLVGDPGVGKTAIVEGLAWRIVKGEVPEILKDKEIFEISMASLVAGTQFHGQFEERFLAVFNKVKESAGQIIVFIDEVHTIVGSGKAEGVMDASNIMKPMLARGEVHLIGATTLEEYMKVIEKDAALERRLQKVMVNEPSFDETVTILRGIANKYEQYHGVRIHDNALVSAVNLSTRYITDRFLPDKAIDLIDEAASMIKTDIESMPIELEEKIKQLSQWKVEQAALKSEKDQDSRKRLSIIESQISSLQITVDKLQDKWNNEKKLITNIRESKEKIDQSKIQAERYQLDGKYAESGRLVYDVIPKLEKKLEQQIEKAKSIDLIQEEVNSETIAKVVSNLKGIPITSLVTEERKKLQNLLPELKKYIKGQDQALKAVVSTIHRQRAGIANPNKPVGTFMFLGPTGVGKTEVAKSLARILFNSEKEMIRFDMSEFSDKSSVTKLIGAPPGYIGFEQSGLLTKAVRNKPYSIILFDEVEKANPDIYNVLLQILDDGRLTDAQGRVANFKNTIIIMTTNAAQNKILNKAEYSKVISTLETYFKPEFLNRIDEIIPFNPLEGNVIEQIVEKELDLLSERLLEQHYRITYDNKVRSKIVSESFDPIYGARPIRRYIIKNIENLIAEKIVDEFIQENKPYLISANSKNKIEIFEKELL